MRGGTLVATDITVEYGTTVVLAGGGGIPVAETYAD